MTSQQGKRTAMRISILGLAESQEGESVATPRANGIVGTALNLHRDALLDKLEKLEAEVASAASPAMRLVEIDPSLIDDPLPADRDHRAYSDAAFEALQADIANSGQHVPILLRVSTADPDRYEIAAGRRRLSACRSLGRHVLARVLDVDDEAMLALQFRENALRKDISTLERGRWILQLGEQRGLSTTKVAALIGMSQPMIVEYQQLARLPASLLDGLADPRELSLADARRLQKALKREGALERMIAALRAAPVPQGTKVQLKRVLHAAFNSPDLGSQRDSGALQAQIIADDHGRRLGVLTRSGAQWVCRFAADIDEQSIRHVVDQIPKLFAAWRKNH